MSLLWPNAPAEPTYPCIRFTWTVEGKYPIKSFYVVRRKSEFFRGWRWPPAHWYYPGGILDAQGRHFKIEGLSGWAPCPRWIEPLQNLLGLDRLIFWLLYGTRFRLILSSPATLSVPEFRDLFAKMIYSDADANKKTRAAERRTRGRLEAASTYNGIIDFAEWYQFSDGGKFDV